MFDNVDEKIKTIAKIVLGLGSIFFFVVGLYVTFKIDNAVIGISIIIGGMAGSIVTSFVLYGFGEMVTNSFIVTDKYIDETQSTGDKDDLNTKPNSISKERSISEIDFTHCQKCNKAFNSDTYIHYNQNTGEILCHDCFSGIKNREDFKFMLGIPSDKNS